MVVVNDWWLGGETVPSHSTEIIFMYMFFILFYFLFLSQGLLASSTSCVKVIEEHASSVFRSYQQAVRNFEQKVLPEHRERGKERCLTAGSKHDLHWTPIFGS